MFPSNGNSVLTPRGQRAVVANDQNRSAIEVHVPDPEATFRSEFYRAEELRPAPKLDDKALTKVASENINTQVNDATKAFGSVQKHARKQSSGETTLQNSEESDED